jgi:hypothetical protein
VNDNYEAELTGEFAERRSRCKFAVETSMHKMIRDLISSGWQESEIAITLADAAEDHVMQLAVRMTRPQLRLA